MDLLTIIEVIKAVLLLSLCAYLMVYLTRGAIYLPSHDAAITQMINALQIKPGEKVVDLGSGDGRVLIAMAKAGAKEVVGYEVNPLLVWWSRARIQTAGVADRVKVYQKSFWRVSLNDVQGITLFGITYIMKEMEEKLLKELPMGVRVVSNGFQFPNWKGEKVADGVYLYRK
jgi:ribosomal protein L11 methylase PrmA